MERINPRNGCHFFTVCHTDRPTSSYAINFATDDFTRFVPSLRHSCRLVGDQLSRYDWTLGLDAVQLSFVELVNGQRTIDDIISIASDNGSSPREPRERLTQMSREVFQSLWQLDFFAMGL